VTDQLLGVLAIQSRQANPWFLAIYGVYGYPSALGVGNPDTDQSGRAR
jgi:hypothetical protein